MKGFFKGVAIVFHPLFMPIFGAAIALFSIPYFKLAINSQVRIFLLLLLSVNVIAPAISLGTMVSKRIISDIQVSNHKQRFIPLILMIFYYTVSYILLRVKLDQPYLPVEVYSMFLGVIISLLIALAISFSFKISLHALGISGILGVVSALAMKYSFHYLYSELFWITVLALITGLVGTSRLYTNHHKLSEVILGTAVGFVVNYVVVYKALVF